MYMNICTSVSLSLTRSLSLHLLTSGQLSLVQERIRRGSAFVVIIIGFIVAPIITVITIIIVDITRTVTTVIKVEQAVVPEHKAPVVLVPQRDQLVMRCGA